MLPSPLFRLNLQRTFGKLFQHLPGAMRHCKHISQYSKSEIRTLRMWDITEPPTCYPINVLAISIIFLVIQQYENRDWGVCTNTNWLTNANKLNKSFSFKAPEDMFILQSAAWLFYFQLLQTLYHVTLSSSLPLPRSAKKGITLYSCYNPLIQVKV